MTSEVPTSAGERLVGVDVARCLALLGMIAVHVLPGVVDGDIQPAQRVAAGRASALFAVLAGVSLVLVAGTRAPLRGRAWAGMAAGTVARAALLAVVGLSLGALDTGIAVILVSYALFFLVVLPFLALPTAPLVAVTVAWTLTAPAVSYLLRSRLPWTSYDVPEWESLAAPGRLLRELVLTGYYPALTWAPYLLVGVLVARTDLRRPRTLRTLLAAGALAVAAAWSVSTLLLLAPGARAGLVRSFSGAGWDGDLDTTLADGLHGVTPTGSPWWLAVRAPHSGTTFDLLMTGGAACAVLACCLLLASFLPRVCAVVFGAGAMTLTLYTLHVLLRSRGWWDGHDAATFGGHAALVLLIGAAYRGLDRRGPLERAVGEAGASARRVVAGPR